MSLFQAIRGMHDILPNQIHFWQYLEDKMRHLANQYGYEEIRTPLVETTGLFKRTIGEVTDIVEKEMYTFQDRHEDRSLTLRPEGTAGCVRAVLEHSLAYNKTSKLWYMGPLFRHEKPQRGRCRQFHQFGMEAFGIPTPDIEAEMLVIIWHLWQQLGLRDKVQLELNTLGSVNARQAYREALVQYFERYRSDLDEDSLRRLALNPLRILDSKNPALQEIILNAPKIQAFLEPASEIHFAQLCEYLQHLNIPFILNPRLVRGLDYYCETIFEWTTQHLGAQSALGAGGRYDGLVELLGGQPTPAFGFALGCERIVELLKDTHESEIFPPKPHIYCISQNYACQQEMFLIAEHLRDTLPQLKILIHYGQGSASFKSQFKKADQSGAALAFILGQEEKSKGLIAIKFLRENREQQLYSKTDVTSFLRDYFSF